MDQICWHCRLPVPLDDVAVPATENSRVVCILCFTVQVGRPLRMPYRLRRAVAAVMVPE